MTEKATPKLCALIASVVCVWLALGANAANQVVESLKGAIEEPVRLDSGFVSGVAVANTGIRVFKGIPFAAPPVGPLRWHAPMPPARWSGVRAADQFAPMPMQPLQTKGSFYQQEYFEGGEPPMSEDCLYLNVWTGAKSAQERRPVMVWIYGGGMVTGYGSEPCFDGTAFARKGVVLVTFNYRVGIFGLFAHPELSAESEHHVSGNYAELDQIAALQWVQRNIGAFGGDPLNVTIFGQSAGGASINRLLVSPLAKGVFHKVIVQSAAILNSRDSKARLAEMEQRGIAFARTNGVQSLSQLRALTATNILAAARLIRFDPNIDGWVLPELAVNIYARGGQYPAPMLIGSTSDEGAYVPIKAEAFRQDAQKRYGAGAAEFLKLYPADSDEEAAQSKHDARRDESFAGERAEARAQAALGQPVYLYYFARKPPGRDRDRYGAFHAAEVEYVFNTLNATTRPWEETDRRLAETLIAYWSKFAATGNPNGADQPQWPAYNPKTDLVMVLGDRVAARPVADKARLEFTERILNRDAR
jgi:para-nitrobenzyl esterase